MIIPNRQAAAQHEPLVWTGDLADDCLARWAGLLWRAEWMDADWWWAVYDLQAEGEPQLDSSHDYEERYTSSEQARAAAEAVAKRYIAQAAR